MVNTVYQPTVTSPALRSTSALLDKKYRPIFFTEPGKTLQE